MAGAAKVQVSTAFEWPSREQFKKADLIVMFARGNWTEQKLNDLEQYLARGGGFVAVHPCVIANKALARKLAGLIGLAWEDGYTRWRHGPMDLKITAADHPICLGLPKTIHFLDEAYWPLKGDLGKVKVLATSDEKLSKDSDESKPEPMFYAYRYGKGRAFSCIPGHYTWTFDDPYFRILLLRGMAWAAGESPYRFDSLVLTGCADSGR
ncbi:MAG: ThuA domain-containing protein [Planctomycetes bacterium]|nr:ThuA domain-containing protein [Planctomycetota bacterium]